MELAHDLQLKLLPSLDAFAGSAEVAARCVAGRVRGRRLLPPLPPPRRPPRRHDRRRLQPRLRRRAHHGAHHERRGHPRLRGRLRPPRCCAAPTARSSRSWRPRRCTSPSSTGSSIPRSGASPTPTPGTPTPSASPRAGEAAAPGATNPPLGIVDLDTYCEQSADWEPGDDLLFLFTDGLSDALGGRGRRRGAVLARGGCAARPAAPVDDLLSRVFALSADGAAPTSPPTTAPPCWCAPDRRAVSPPRPGPHRAKKSLGQNFLVDPNLQRKIVEALDPGPDDEVLEIGPGRGALTRHLAPRVRRLVLVELDDDLAERLRAEFAGTRRVRGRPRRRPRPPPRGGHRRPSPASRSSATSPTTSPPPSSSPSSSAAPPARDRPHGAARGRRPHPRRRRAARPTARSPSACRAVADAERVLQVGRHAFRPVPDVESTVVRIRPPPPAPPRPRRRGRASAPSPAPPSAAAASSSSASSATPTASPPSGSRALEQRTGFDLRRRPESFSPDEFVALARGAGTHDGDGCERPGERAAYL